MDGPESLWLALALALGWRRCLDFSSEAGLLEMQVSAFLPGSPAEEAAERFAAERDIGVGLELARLLKAESEGCESERRARLADLAEFAELLCTCLGDATAAAAVARNLFRLSHERLVNDGLRPAELTIAAIGWLDASVRIKEIVASPNPPGDAVVMGVPSSSGTSAPRSGGSAPSRRIRHPARPRRAEVARRSRTSIA